MYSRNDKGAWWRTEWSAQCPKKAYLSDKCQGVLGHKGVHWAFGADGSFHYGLVDGGCGCIPPGHKDYRTPQSMQKLHYLRFKKTVKVTDKAIIAKLEKDKTPEKDASINRPVELPLPPYLEERIRSLK
jgi:hypothetical protein